MDIQQATQHMRGRLEDASTALLALTSAFSKPERWRDVVTKQLTLITLTYQMAGSERVGSFDDYIADGLKIAEQQRATAPPFHPLAIVELTQATSTLVALMGTFSTGEELADVILQQMTIFAELMEAMGSPLAMPAEQLATEFVEQAERNRKRVEEMFS